MKNITFYFIYVNLILHIKFIIYYLYYSNKFDIYVRCMNIYNVNIYNFTYSMDDI